MAVDLRGVHQSVEIKAPGQENLACLNALLRLGPCEMVTIDVDATLALVACAGPLIWFLSMPNFHPWWLHDLFDPLVSQCCRLATAQIKFCAKAKSVQILGDFMMNFCKTTCHFAFRGH